MKFLHRLLTAVTECLLQRVKKSNQVYGRRAAIHWHLNELEKIDPVFRVLREAYIELKARELKAKLAARKKKPARPANRELSAAVCDEEEIRIAC